MLRVDMKEARIHWEPVPQEYEQVGGRALIAKASSERNSARL